jgi:hypothetical protein
LIGLKNGANGAREKHFDVALCLEGVHSYIMLHIIAETPEFGWVPSPEDCVAVTVTTKIFGRQSRHHCMEWQNSKRMGMSCLLCYFILCLGKTADARAHSTLHCSVRCGFGDF